MEGPDPATIFTNRIVHVIRASDRYLYRTGRKFQKKHDIYYPLNYYTTTLQRNSVPHLLTFIRILSIRLRRDSGAEFNEGRAIVEICERAVDAKSPFVVIMGLGESIELEARERGGITCLALIFKPHPAAGNHSHTAGASNLAVGSFQLRGS
jgi:hypothetical protein